MDKIISLISEFYTGIGISNHYLVPITTLTAVAFGVVIMYLVYYLLCKYIEPLLTKLIDKTSIKWDDIVFRHKVLRWFWVFLPLIIGQETLPAALSAYPAMQSAIIVILRIMLVLTLMMLVIETVRSVFMLIGDRDNIDHIAAQMQEARNNGEEYEYKPSHSLKGLEQMIIVLIVGFAIILCISIVFGKDPLIVLSGLGAAAAIIMLVFQDSILGVVAGVQLTANDMLQPGDWIIAPKYQANGIVREITLAAVKVENWDKSTITIPPYHLITEGFQNWRGMQEAKGRRIARSINIDMSSVRFATEQEMALWTKTPWWKAQKDKKEPVVNLTAFRMYLEYYISNIPSTRHNMLYMIRELQPTSDGLPLEIYFFTTKTEWKSYEILQADMLDHVLAVINKFDLRVYQHPSGHDIVNR